MKKFFVILMVLIMIVVVAVPVVAKTEIPFISFVFPSSGTSNDWITIHGNNLMDTIPSGIMVEFLRNGIQKGVIRGPLYIQPDGLALRFQLCGILVGNIDSGIYQLRVVNDRGKSNVVDIYIIPFSPSLTTTLRLQVGSPELIMEREGIKRLINLNTIPAIPLKMNRVFLPTTTVIDIMSKLFGVASLSEKEDKNYILRSGGREIVFQINNPIVRVNGVLTPIDPTQIAGMRLLVKPHGGLAGQSMLPLRFVAETLGAQVFWDGVARTVTIIYPR